jgi:hypothetical protein
MAAGLAAALVAGGLVAGGAALGSGGATASAGTAAVAAAPAPPPLYLWWAAECATGEITGAAYNDDGYVEITGTAVLCGGLAVSSFTVVPFWSDTTTGVAVGNQLVRYAPIGEATGFRAVLTTRATQSEGICLMLTQRQRGNCVTVADGPDGTLVLSPAPAASPAWTERVHLAQGVVCEDVEPDGICATCVGVRPTGIAG